MHKIPIQVAEGPNGAHRAPILKELNVTRSQLRWLLSVNNLIYYDLREGEFMAYAQVYERHIRWYLTTVGEPIES